MANETSYPSNSTGSSSKTEIQEGRGNTLLALRKTLWLVRKQEHLTITFLAVLHHIWAHRPAPNGRMGMQVSETTSLVQELKSLTEHNQLRTGIISKSYPNYSSTNYLSATQSYRLVLTQITLKSSRRQIIILLSPQVPHFNSNTTLQVKVTDSGRCKTVNVYLIIYICL